MSRLCRLRNKTHGEDGQWEYEEITKLRETLAAQAAVIEALKESAQLAVEMIEYNKHERRHVRWKLNDAIALSIPTNSTQILDELLQQERERCAVLCEKSDRYRGDYFADKIRAME